jgi:hypothetical protein
MDNKIDNSKEIKTVEPDKNEPPEDDSSEIIKTTPISKVAVELETIFTHLKPQIKVPKLSQEKPWALAKLPIFVFSTPFISTNALRVLGIKYHQITNGIILENQLVLCLLSTYAPQKDDAPAQTKKSMKIDLREGSNPVFNSPLFLRAQSVINHQFNTEYLYSDPFASKEVAQPIKFLWMLTPKQVNLLGRLKIKVLGLPYAPDLNKAEDLTDDSLKIKESVKQATDMQNERVAHKNELLKSLVDERNRLKQKFKEIKDKLSFLKKELEFMDSSIAAIKADYAKASNPTKKMELKLLLERNTFQRAKMQREFDSYIDIHAPLVKDQMATFEETFKKAYKSI